MSYALVGKVWDAESFEDYVKGLNLSWAQGITLHHTGTPNLSQRPKGFTIQHIRNIASYYKSKLGWSRGPHLFLDEDQIFGMSPLTERGIHAKSFNSSYIGIEVLGNYDSESPNSGRGLKCWQNAIEVVAILQKRHPNLKIINGHRDDSRTSKTCPGKLVDLDEFRSQVARRLVHFVDDRKDDESLLHTPSDKLLIEIKAAEKAVASAEWQLKKLKETLAEMKAA